jgi:hypothetical protein
MARALVVGPAADGVTRGIGVARLVRDVFDCCAVAGVAGAFVGGHGGCEGG